MSLANIKRRLVAGAKIELVRWEGFPGRPNGVPEKIKGVREVAKAQTNAVQFSGGSWLSWPPANQVRETPTGFEVCLSEDGSFSKLMAYEWR